MSRSSIRTMLLLVYFIVLPLAGRGIFEWNERLALVTFFALLLPMFALLRWPHTPLALMTGFIVMLVGKLAYAVTTDPLAGPDEIHYYEQVTGFERLSQFIPYAMEHFETQWMNISAYPVFGMLYMPFYKWLQLDDPLAIIWLNTVLLMLTANSAFRLNDRYFAYPMPEGSRDTFDRTLIFTLLASPSLMYMSSLFAKDVACVLLGLYGASLMLRRKWLLFIVVIAYATGLRDYAIVYTLCFYLLYTRRLKTAIGVMGAACAVIVLQIGPLGLINAGMLTVFLFISPNPINPGNWEPELLMRTAEAVLMTAVLVASVYQYARRKETRPFYTIAFILLFIYACALVLVGYVTVMGRSLEYGLGTIGDNMVRKKLPVIPLIYTICAYTFAWSGGMSILKRLKILSKSSKTVIFGRLLPSKIGSESKGGAAVER
ncbi:hypothetical protein PCCS19_29520 [Paenibacillus sp. CCS19]|nr:hypothetical protein PCCS19_29520 [Paenibacillus cellulosilyticus]